jgi:hypothetical protein
MSKVRTSNLIFFSLLDVNSTPLWFKSILLRFYSVYCAKNPIPLSFSTIYKLDFLLLHFNLVSFPFCSIILFLNPQLYLQHNIFVRMWITCLEPTEMMHFGYLIWFWFKNYSLPLWTGLILKLQNCNNQSKFCYKKL